MRFWRGAAALALLLPACSGESEQPDTERSRLPLAAPLASAFCDIVVDGVGAVAAESVYVPGVITCENGGANLEALKAQAIAARSVAYWSMGTDGSICDSQACQVYSCGRSPGPLELRAVEETSGLYLSYDSLVTYGAYVDGDHGTSPPTCVGSASSGNPGASRERWITYNEGKTGADVEMSDLIFVPNQPIFGQNRGCMSQWGARCLENDLGYDYDRILRFYYGADIQILQAEGPCVVSVGRAPSGTLESATCEDGIVGWSQDADTPSVAVDISLYIDEEPGDPAAAPAVVVMADENRPDLCATLGSCDHGFFIPVPAEVLDGAAHTLRVYAADTDDGTLRELSGSPTTLQCASGVGGAGGGASGAAGAPPVGAGGQPPTGTGGAAGSSGPEPGAENRTRVVNESDGCSCRTAGVPAPHSTVLLALLGLVGVGLRRRRTA